LFDVCCQDRFHRNRKDRINQAETFVVERRRPV
jgi:hypothetical protein